MAAFGRDTLTAKNASVLIKVRADKPSEAVFTNEFTKEFAKYLVWK